MMTCPLAGEERIMSIESLVRHFSVVEDPRCQGKIEHRLIDILVRLLLASGVLGWVIRPRRQRARRAGLCRDGARCARTGRSRDRAAASPARDRGAGGARSAAATRTPRWG